MGRKSTFDQNNASLVEEYVDTAYDNVKLVADNLDAILALPTPEEIATLTTEYQTLNDAVSATIPQLQTDIVDVDNAVAAANTSATNAATSEQLAADWAEKGDGLDVDGVGTRSAKHHSNQASASATAAASSATDASNSASSATTFATNASNSASAASTSETNASGFATAAATSATNAANSATAIATSETNAGNSATAAATSATNASNSATIASGHATSADNARIAAEAALDEFTDLYLGPKAVAPTLDNDNNALQVGALYWNTGNDTMYSWNGSTWVVNYSPSNIQNASEVPFTPTGSIASTDVQAAIAELDADVSGISVVTAASGITYSNTTSSLIAVNTQAAIDEVVERVDTLEGVTHTHSNKAILDGTTASYTTADASKLSGIESNATADQTGAEIKAAYEAELDTNAYTDTEKSKLAGIEVNATADQTAIEIEALLDTYYGDTSWRTGGGGGGTSWTIVETTAPTLASGDMWLVDSSVPRTGTLPATPSANDEVIIKDDAGNAATNNITVARNGSTILGNAADFTLDVNFGSVRLKYNGTTWKVVN